MAAEMSLRKLLYGTEAMTAPLTAAVPVGTWYWFDALKGIKTPCRFGHAAQIGGQNVTVSMRPMSFLLAWLGNTLRGLLAWLIVRDAWTWWKAQDLVTQDLALALLWAAGAAYSVYCWRKGGTAALKL
jgi:hypothetical protein